MSSAARNGDAEHDTNRRMSRAEFTALVRHNARDRWREICAALGVDLPPSPIRGGPCGCGGVDRLRFDDKEGRGTWICSQGTGETTAGDGFDLLRHIYGWSFPEAVDEVARVLNITSGTAKSLEVAKEQQARWKKQRQERQAASHEEAMRKHKAGAQQAALLWKNAKGVTGHSYLQRKGVQAHGLRVAGGLLLVPMRDTESALWNVQRIDANGTKRFLPGRKRGLFHLLGEPGEFLVLAEGFATGATVREATGLPVAVAFDAGNLLPVAEALAERYRHAGFIFAADNDQAGLTQARKAAESVGGTIFAPAVEGADWNDVGREAVQEAIRELTAGERR